MTNQIKVKEELREAFQSAQSVEGMLKNMREMESLFQESELGMECWALAHKLSDPDKILYFGIRALNIFIDKQKNNIPCFYDDHNHGYSFFIPSVLNLLASACLDLLMYDESLNYLNWARKDLTKLLDNDCRDNCVLLALLATHQVLFKVNVAMGNGNEALVNARKVLEIREKTMEEDCVEIGEANKDVGVACLGVKSFSEALPFTLKALEIYEKCVGGDSEELALVKKNLEVIYGELGEHKKALGVYKTCVRDDTEDLDLVRENVEVNVGLGEHELVLELRQLSLSGMENVASSSPRCSGGAQCSRKMMEIGDKILALGLNEEAIEFFKDAASLAEAQGNHEVRAVSLVFVARGLCNQGKFPEAKRYMKIALRIFEKKETDPLIRATAFEDMSKVYEKMNEYDNALSYLKRAVAIPELPREHLIDTTLRLFSLICERGRQKQKISYLNELVERLKKKLGPEHVLVGFCYLNIGLGHMLSDKLEEAAEFFVLAKKLFDVSLGPHHLDSLRTSQTISVTYARLGRYEPATVIQECVVKSLRGHQGPRGREFLNIAVELLKYMKEKVAGPISWKVLSLKMAEFTLQQFLSLPNQKQTCDSAENNVILFFFSV